MELSFSHAKAKNENRNDIVIALKDSHRSQKQMEMAYKPMDIALGSMKSDEATTVKIDTNSISFQLKNHSCEKGLIIFPGAFVDFRGYAPLARAISEKGYQVVILKMPLDFPLLGEGRATKTLKEYPHIKTWALAGHSAGGVLAGRLTEKSNDIKGLALWASYTDVDLSKKDLKVTTLIGSEDKVLPKWLYNKEMKKLPKDTEKILIEGGNHAYFGYYGSQIGDGKATISREAQQQILFESTLNLLRKI